MQAKNDFEKLTELYKQSRKDLNFFRSRIQLSEAEDTEKLEPTFFHKRWSEELLFSKKNIACEGFRECGKSSLIKAFLLYCLTFPDINRSYIAIMRSNKTGASKILKEVARDFMLNPLMYGASHVKTIEESADAFCITTSQGIIIRIEAYGKGSAIRGAAFNNRRPDVVVLDDIQDKEDMRSPTLPENDWDWFLSDIKFLGKQTRFFFIGNNLGEKCIIERLIKSANENGEGLFGFQCYRIPSMDKDGKATWEERFSVDMLIKERKEMEKEGKLSIWLMERMCQAVCPELQVFKREDWRYFGFKLTDVIRDKSNCFMTIDPAISPKEHADFRACCVNCIDEDNYWHIIDMAYGRWLPDEMWNIVFDLVQKWKIKVVGIEEGVFKIMAENGLGGSIYDMMKDKNIYFELVPLKHGGTKKEIRIAESLSARFKAHTILFPDQAGDWLEELKSELLGFTMEGSKSLHDDLLDALAYQVQIARKPFNMSTIANKVTQMETTGQLL